MKRTKILVVDDEIYTREFLKELLEKEGYEVTTVTDGQQAIEAVKKDVYQIIFLDIIMPGMDGLDTFKEIKKSSLREVTVIIITAYTLEKEIKEALRLGAYTCLHKPFNLIEVLKITQEIIGRDSVIGDQ